MNTVKLSSISGRLKFVKMMILPNFTYRFNIKYQNCIYIYRIILEFLWKWGEKKKARIASTILKNKNKAERFKLPDTTALLL